MQIKINPVLHCFTVVLFCTSCLNTKKVTYFNDITDKALIASQAGLEPIIQKNDILSITVSSLSTEATLVFNAPNLPASPIAGVNTALHETAGYFVNQDGYINFPILGKLKAAGLSKKQFEENIAKQLLEKKLLFDPIVNIRYLNYRVTVLGEVGRPGVIDVPSEQISILEAIGKAGDLTIYGRRDNVILIRQEGDKKNIQRLNLNSSDMLSSPYFFLKSNDVVYVEPVKARVANASLGQQLLPSILSGLSIAAVVIISLLK